MSFLHGVARAVFVGFVPGAWGGEMDCGGSGDATVPQEWPVDLVVISLDGHGIYCDGIRLRCPLCRYGCLVRKWHAAVKHGSFTSCDE